ncbi:FtsK/SpoIIIE domain-containing protein [Streptomyces sp. NPDC001691]|uniref:FtsK/SpoIIIE domain-containing protein n=1 Tax=Streptomyces sp. NPDC001691 TaxID=3364600 RepID=UPI003681391D
MPASDRRLLRAAVAVARAAGTASRWCFRQRYELAPGAASLTLSGLGWLHHLAGVDWPDHAVYGLSTAAAGALAAGGLKHKKTVLSAAGAAMAVVVGDVWINASSGPTAPGLVASGVTTAAAYAAYIPWLVRRRDERMRLQIDAAKAGAAPGALGIEGTDPGVTAESVEETRLRRALTALGVTPLDVTALRFSADGWTALVTLPPGRRTSAEVVIAQRQQLAANLDLPGRLLLSVGSQDNQLLVRMQVNDPLAETIEWPGPSITSVAQEMVLGRSADGSEVRVCLLYQHSLIAGATDNGKSGILNVVVGNLAACDDAELLLVDMKPGAVELGPWRRCARAFADSPAKARALLRMVRAEVERRGQVLAELSAESGEPVRKWVPGVHGTAWFVVIDELAELIRQDPKLAKELEALRQLARFVAIQFVEATQAPSRKVFGGDTDARQQYQVRIGLGVAEGTTVNLVMGPGALGAGWRLDELNRPGKFMISSRAHADPAERRAFWMTDAQIAATVHRYGGVEAVELVVPKKGAPEPPDPPRGPDGGGGGGGERPALHVVPTYPDGSEIPTNRVALWQAIEKAGPEGISIPALVALGLPNVNARGSASDPIQQWRRQGWVVEAGKDAARAMRFRVATRRTTIPAAPAAEKGRTAVRS